MATESMTISAEALTGDRMELRTVLSIQRKQNRSGTLLTDQHGVLRDGALASIGVLSSRQQT